MSGYLRLDSLVVGEGRFRLGPISLQVQPGQSLAILGPNGAGKSSLLRTLAGLRRPRSGRVEGPGAVAWMPPPGAVQTGLDVLTMTALGRAALHPWAPSLSRADRECAHAALSGLGLGGLSDRPFDTLSSGQQQLVLIARLTVQAAPVCLVDEPTALLDPAHAAHVTSALSDLSRAGRVVVMATHDLGLAARADRLLLLGREPVETTPEAGLTPDHLEQVFGVPLSLCPCCGRPAPGFVRHDMIRSCD